MEKRKIIRPIIIVVCIYMIITTVQGSVDLLRSGDKVTRRENELARLTRIQQELTARKKQADSQDYLEQMAYGKLGLSRPGEEVIIIPSELLVDQSPKVMKKNDPNWKKWMELLL